MWVAVAALAPTCSPGPPASPCRRGRDLVAQLLRLRILAVARRLGAPRPRLLEIGRSWP
ncbi:MAG: hypothetical protein M3257_10470 [Actinomycetota bacterium]|nr:hypothetical protein [Actinomycetota bacterium]